MRFVADASIASRGLMKSQLLPEASVLLEGVTDLSAPPVFRQESVNSFFLATRRGRMPEEEAGRLMDRLDALPIRYSDSPIWIPRALAIAREFRQPSIFDAIDLACAEDLDAELWTCDRRFVESFGARRPARLKLCPDDISVTSPDAA